MWNEGDRIEPSAHYGMHEIREYAATDVQERPRVKVGDEHNALDLIGPFLAECESCGVYFSFDPKFIEVGFKFLVFTLKPV